jgi:hypothetical protein
MRVRPVLCGLGQANGFGLGHRSYPPLTQVTSAAREFSPLAAVGVEWPERGHRGGQGLAGRCQHAEGEVHRRVGVRQGGGSPVSKSLDLTWPDWLDFDKSTWPRQPLPDEHDTSVDRATWAASDANRVQRHTRSRPRPAAPSRPGRSRPVLAHRTRPTRHRPTRPTHPRASRAASHPRRHAIRTSIEEALQDGGEVGHDASRASWPAASRRPAARARSSGTAERYQYVDFGSICPSQVNRTGSLAWTSPPSRPMGSRNCRVKCRWRRGCAVPVRAASGPRRPIRSCRRCWMLWWSR